MVTKMEIILGVMAIYVLAINVSEGCKKQQFYNVQTGIIENAHMPQPIKKGWRGMADDLIPFYEESKEFIKFPYGNLILKDDVKLPTIATQSDGSCFQAGGIYSKEDIYDFRDDSGKSILMPKGLIERLSESNFFCKEQRRLSQLESKRVSRVKKANEDYRTKARQF